MSVLCLQEDLIPQAGVCVLLDEEAVAIFYVPDAEEKVFALSNWDPIGQASVLSRGIVGDVDGHLVVASPLYKQHFDLRTGQCLEDGDFSVTTYPVRLLNDRVVLSS